ncbi:MAG: hypothetical protein E7673_00200 [Ruminococcaceae bacterium]|nr:hypothetical protein [Oscillospiraceae bacterium]
MKKIYSYVKNMIVARYKLMFAITMILFFVSIISLFFHHVTPVAGLYFAGSFISLTRLITYKTGKIPIFAIDKTWNVIEWRKRKELTYETKEELYEKMSLKSASIHFIIAVFGLCMWIVCEILAFL